MRAHAIRRTMRALRSMIILAKKRWFSRFYQSTAFSKIIMGKNHPRLTKIPNRRNKLRAARSTLLGKISKIMLFVTFVVAVECGVAYWYLPSAAETAALAGSAIDEQKKQSP